MRRGQLHQMPVRGLTARFHPRRQPIGVQVIWKKSDRVSRIELDPCKLRASLIDIGEIFGSLGKNSDETEFRDGTGKQGGKLPVRDPCSNTQMKLMLANSERNQCAYIQQISR